MDHPFPIEHRPPSFLPPEGLSSFPFPELFLFSFRRLFRKKAAARRKEIYSYNLATPPALLHGFFPPSYCGSSGLAGHDRADRSPFFPADQLTSSPIISIIPSLCLILVVEIRMFVETITSPLRWHYGLRPCWRSSGITEAMLFPPSALRRPRI